MTGPREYREVRGRLTLKKSRKWILRDIRMNLQNENTNETTVDDESYGGYDKDRTGI